MSSYKISRNEVTGRVEVVFSLAVHERWKAEREQNRSLIGKVVTTSPSKGARRYLIVTSNGRGSTVGCALSGGISGSRVHLANRISGALLSRWCLAEDQTVQFTGEKASALLELARGIQQRYERFGYRVCEKL